MNELVKKEHARIDAEKSKTEVKSEAPEQEEPEVVPKKNEEGEKDDKEGKKEDV